VLWVIAVCIKSVDIISFLIAVDDLFYVCLLSQINVYVDHDEKTTSVI